MTIALGTLDAGVLAHVDGAGCVSPAGSLPLDWWVVAEDRVHHPVDEASVRQRRVDGTPVVETLVRVPGGDLAATVYAVAGTAPGVVIELENRSPAAVAVAFARPVLADRALHAPPPGAGLPDGSVLVPVGHRSSVRVALVAPPSVVMAGLPTSAQVARGWMVQAATGPRLVLPEPLDGLLVPAMCDALVTPEKGDEVSSMLGAALAGERGGQLDDDAVLDIAAAAERVCRGHRRTPSLPWLDALALDASAVVLDRAGERPAAADVRAAIARLAAPEPLPLTPPPAERPLERLAWLRAQLVRPTRAGVELMGGATPGWLGRPVEAHDVPTSYGAVGAAVRWHGERPALLWSRLGAASTGPITLTAPALDPSWRTDEGVGEALLAPPPSALAAGRAVHRSDA